MNIVCFSSILVFPGNSGVGEHARLTPPLLRRNLKLQEEASSVCVFLSLQTDMVTFKVLFLTSQLMLLLCDHMQVEKGLAEKLMQASSGTLPHALVLWVRTLVDGFEL